MTPLCIADLAAAKGLPESLLRGLGLEDTEDGVAIPYYTTDGMLVVRKVRLALEGPRQHRWPAGLPLLPYGLWRLDQFRRLGLLILVEGESDCWALWHHGFPALGLPGSNSAACLEAEALESITHVYIHREPDRGGTTFLEGCKVRLRQLRFAGEVRQLVLPDGIKDPADLHRESPDRFAARLDPCLRSAVRLSLAPTPTNGHATNGHTNGHHANGHASHSSGTEPLEVPLPPPAEWPEPILEAAWYGLAGQIVQLLAPQTEADPVAILIQLLAAFGNVIGRHAHWRVESDRHYGNLYCCLVGDSSVGRKGVSLGRALSAFSAVNDSWARERVYGGLSSGEGLIWAVRDPIYGTHAIKKNGRIVDTQQVMSDRGVHDKRLLVVETEFVRPLQAMQRQGNTLSAILRQGWDSGNLASMTRTSAARATGAHLSVIGHITRTELARSLSSTELSNGFANRFLWLASRRARLLPLGGEAVELGHLAHQLALAVEQAQLADEIGLDPDAAAFFSEEVYPRLNEPAEGLRGSLLARGPAQVRRLAMLYALLDFSDVVRLPHLLAALALWDYCERSIAWIFQDASGDDPNEREILSALARAQGGLSRNEINRLVFSGRLPAPELTRSLLALRDQGLITEEECAPNGRTFIKYRPTPCALARFARFAPSTNGHNDLQQQG